MPVVVVVVVVGRLVTTSDAMPRLAVPYVGRVHAPRKLRMSHVHSEVQGSGSGRV